MLTRTIGRHAVSLGGSDMLGEETVVIAGSSCHFCLPIQGEQAASVRPSFHLHCDCTATPKGYSVKAHIEAMHIVVAEPAMRRSLGFRARRGAPSPTTSAAGARGPRRADQPPLLIDVAG